MFRIDIKLEDTPFVKLVCISQNIPFQFGLDRDNVFYAEIDLPEEKKEEFLKDIDCEMEAVHTGGFPVYSFETISNPHKLLRLMTVNRTSNYVIYSKDVDKIPDM